MDYALSPTLLSLWGISAGPDEPHLQEGTHLRVAHHPLLGLPVAPFVLQRVNPKLRIPDPPPTRRDYILRNNKNDVLTLPVTIAKGEKVTATIHTDPATTCVAVQMVEATQPKPDKPDPIGDPFTRGRGRGPVIGPGDVRTIPVSNLVMRAYAPSMGDGLTLVGESSALPHTIGAPGITRVVITGEGTITDLVWLADRDLVDLPWETIDVLNLPFGAARRYHSITGGRDRAEARVRTQAPKRRPLHELSEAPDPEDAPVFTPEQELKRVQALTSYLDKVVLKELLEGDSPPLIAAAEHDLTDPGGDPVTKGREGERIPATASIPLLSQVLQSTLDPGVAAWLGYHALVPPAMRLDMGETYRVIGFFRHPSAIGAEPEQLASLPLAGIPAAAHNLGDYDVAQRFSALAAPHLSETDADILVGLEHSFDYLAVAAFAVVPPNSAPPLHAPSVLPPEHQNWHPDPPPSTRRIIDCPVGGVQEGATLALKSEQPEGTYRILNRPSADPQWHLPLTLGAEPVEQGTELRSRDARQGVLTDREAGPSHVRYHVAQQDWFGRWSRHGSALAGEGPRPHPPRPVVIGSYAQPPIDEAAARGGVISLRVPLPDGSSLAPGSLPLDHARLTFLSTTGEQILPERTVPARHTDALVHDSPVSLRVTGPRLQPMEDQRIMITAWWVDTEGRSSAPSEPLRLRMVDPRPPAQLRIPDTLLYSSRPDATGLAYVERTWQAQSSGTTYSAYYSDEVRLVHWLKETGHRAEAERIEATADRAARAGRLREIQAVFPDHLFERLPAAIESASSSTHRLRHAVSGASRVLNAYKIAAEAPVSGARPDLSELDIVFYGVPNSDPPPRPTVDVRMVPPNAGEPPLVAEVTVTVRAGVTAAERARIFRTRGGTPDPLRSPVVSIVPLSAPDEDGIQTAIFRDVGAAQIAPRALLTAYAQYHWFADVQGPPESGSTVPGLWSRAADPRSALTAPPDPPGPPSVSVHRPGRGLRERSHDLHLKVTHDFPLSPTVAGHWSYDVLYAEPGSEWQRLTSGEALASPLSVECSHPGGAWPSGTRLRVQLHDPIGRPLPAVELVT